jgi:PAS domain S-box-containing protein
MGKSRTNRQLEAEVEALRIRLEEAEETLGAIRNNEVDALVIDGPQGQQVFTLQGAEQPYRTLMETMSEGALTVATDGTILYCNQRFAEMLRGPLNRIIGLSFQEIIPSEDWHAFKALLDTCGKEGFRGEYHLTTFEGREIPVYVSARFLRLQDVESFCIVATDLTEQRRLEQQIRQAQKMEALGTMAGGIAHDFNNLLAAVIGFTELLQEDLPVGNPGHRWAARVLEAGLRGRELVKHMLTFSRRAELEKKPLRMSGIVKESVKLLRASVPTTISISVNVRSESGFILADAVQIQQVLINLCTNAAHAMQEKGGALDIELSDFSVGPRDGTVHGIEPGLYIKLMVRDTGIGIPAHVKNRIFDPFFTTKGVGVGTGLGLSVVMGIVKQSGGYITVESEPGKGSAFVVYFPKVTDGPIVKIKGTKKTLPTGSERILFVDDEEALLEIGEQLLTKFGYEVTCQSSGKAALALVKDGPSHFDLVITDQTMPGMTGVELAKAILAIRPDMPVILCTGFSNLVDDESARTTGIRGFAMKPLTKRELAKTIREVLDGTCTNPSPSRSEVGPYRRVPGGRRKEKEN